jgi:hypothetical protein
VTYAEPFVLLRALGVFGTTAAANIEQWNVTMKLRNPGGAPSAANLQAFADAAKARWSTFHTSAGAATGSYVWLTEVQTAYIGTNGLYVGGAGQNTTRSALTTPVQGQGASGAPYTQCLVVSLRTALTRGPGSNGRLYIPWCGGAGIQTGTGTVASSATASMAAAAQVLINGINIDARANLPGTGGVAVMSNVRSGVAATVTSVRVGNRIDTQESRERSIKETYSSLSITPAVFQVGMDVDAPIGTPWTP